MIRLFYLLLVCAQAYSADVPWKWWGASVGIHAVGTAADSYTSWHQVESNPLLCDHNGRFAGTGIAIKVGMLGTVTAIEYGILRVTRSSKAARAFTVVNSALGFGYSAIALQNARAPGRDR